MSENVNFRERTERRGCFKMIVFKILFPATVFNFIPVFHFFFHNLIVFSVFLEFRLGFVGFFDMLDYLMSNSIFEFPIIIFEFISIYLIR